MMPARMCGTDVELFSHTPKVFETVPYWSWQTDGAVITVIGGSVFMQHCQSRLSRKYAQPEVELVQCIPEAVLSQ